jgi:BirA family biotin operon repressor/biotin-[acetyl-CoA-carboxylase] ligase
MNSQLSTLNSQLIYHLPKTESTNQSLRLLADAENLPDKSIVRTDYQTKGRGQVGNTWESAAGMNLLCSILFYPPQLPANQSFAILELAALSVKYTLDKYVPDIFVKWPNDIYLLNKKISGILIENDIAEGLISRSIIGIGINLNQTEFQSDAPNPISLSMFTGNTYDIKVVLNQLHANFTQLANEFETGMFDRLHQNYCTSLYQRDGFHTYEDANGHFKARIHSIEPSGHIILERPNGTLSRYGFKEVKSPFEGG